MTSIALRLLLCLVVAIPLTACGSEPRWRLLATVAEGVPYDAHVATQSSEFAAIRDTFGPPTLPEPDWEVEIAVVFVAVVSSGTFRCDVVQLEDVIIEGGLVAPRFDRPRLQLGCNDDAHARAMIVAIRRDALPEGTISVSGWDPRECADCAGTPPPVRVRLD